MILKNVDHEISLINLFRSLNLYLNRHYNDENENDQQVFTNDKTYVKRIYNIKFKTLRSICQLHFTCEKLKIEYFDRQYVENFFFIRHVSLLYFLFIDDFDVHRNIYRILKVFYLISTNLYDKERN